MFHLRALHDIQSYLLRINAARGCARKVNTWSTLASAFNTKPNRSFAIPFSRPATGLFGLDELKEPDGFYLLRENAMHETEDLLSECISPNRSRKMVEVFDHLSDSLCRVADLSEFIRMAHPQAKYGYAAEDACIAIGGLVEKLNTHRELYECLRNVVQQGDKFSTTEIDKHVGKLFLFDFEQSGIHLDASSRARVVSLSESTLALGQHFMSGAMQPRAIAKDKLPSIISQHFAIDGDNVLVTGLFADAHNEMTREAAYKIFLYPDQHQEYLLTELVNNRHETAKLCGFSSYAHRAVSGSLAGSPDLIVNFLELLAAEVQPRAQEDFKEMENMKKSLHQNKRPLAPWDVPYYTGQARQNKFIVNTTDLSQYFSLGTVMDGLCGLLERLYNIKLQLEDPQPGELWTSDVYKLAVIHKDEGLLGHIYCDFYERPGKAHQDCHFTIRGGKCMADGSYQNPVVVLHLNLPSPSWSCPTLLTPGMVENLFHEMGHAMHSMLARTQYQHVTGTRCSTDFAEVPSILMEFFAQDPRVLHSFARHYKTGEKIPFDVLQRLVASKSVYSASELQLQTFYSLLDQRYHGEKRWPSSTTTTNILEEVQNDFYGLPYVKDTAWQLRFGHLVGYGAKYYAYLVSRAVASWIWQEYFINDPFSSEMGEKLRREVLVHGGGKPPQQMVGEFLGKEVNAQNLVDALILDLEQKRIRVDSCTP